MAYHWATWSSWSYNLYKKKRKKKLERCQLSLIVEANVALEGTSEHAIPLYLRVSFNFAFRYSCTICIFFPITAGWLLVNLLEKSFLRKLAL